MPIEFGYSKLYNKMTIQRFIVDGKSFSGDDGLLSEVDGKRIADVKSPRLIGAIAPKELMQLPRSVGKWGFHLEPPFPEMILYYILEREQDADRLSKATLEINFTSGEWRYPWSVSDYCRLFQLRAREVIAGCGKCEHRAHPSLHSLTIPLNVPEMTMSVGAELGRRGYAIREIHRKIQQELVVQLNPQSLVAFFDFPAEHGAAGKQYLTYFTDFLRSLGVDADSALYEESRKVLFTVTPTGGKDALERVRQALGIYLQLPNGTVSPSDLAATNQEVQRVALAIQHLQSMVGQVGSPVAASVVACGSGGNLTDKESFFGGRLLIKPFAKGPFELNLPKFIRDFKARFPILKKLE